MLWVEQKYIQLLGPRLRNFKRKSDYLWNFSCPLCGDSKTRPRAARGYVYRKGDKLNYDCKKCGRGMSVRNFIRQLDPVMFDEMQLEMFQPRQKEKLPDLRPERPVFDKKIDPYKGLVKVSKLPRNHMCRQFVEKRFIPEMYWDDLYFTDAFYTWSGYVLPGRYKVPKTKLDDEPRLVIPMRNMKGETTAFQGRQLVGENIGQKYVFVALTKEEKLIWGLDKIDPTKKVYAFEGPIDAMFIPNAIGVGGGDISSDVLYLDIPPENIVVVYDNEPRKPETIGKMLKAINKGLAICVWPEIDEGDVNDMVKARIRYGIAEACMYIYKKISENVYSGPSALIALERWKKINPEIKKQKQLLKAANDHK